MFCYLQHAGVKFTQRPNATPVVVTAQAVPRNTLNEQLASARNEVPATTQQRESQTASPSRYLLFHVSVI